MSPDVHPSSQVIPLQSEDRTHALGHALAEALVPGALVILEGNLGAGKTFLAGAIVHALGLDLDEPVTSPTYNLVSEYATKFAVFHADLYRLKSENEVFDLGLDESRDRGGVLLIEWGLPYVPLLGGDALVVELQTTPREARLRATGPRSELIRKHVIESLARGELKAPS